MEITKYQKRKEQELEEIKTLFLKQNLTIDQIAKKLGVKTRRVDYLIYDVIGVRKRQSFSVPKGKENKVIQLLNFGYSVKEIAEGEGLKMSDVRAIINHRGHEVNSIAG